MPVFGTTEKDMTKPIVTVKDVPVSGVFSFGTREFFIDGESIGEFDDWEEDGSGSAVEVVLEKLDELGIIEFDR